jgi:hypothetical protein
LDQRRQTRRLSEALDACYEQFGPFRYQPQRADQMTQKQALQWRKAMGANPR